MMFKKVKNLFMLSLLAALIVVSSCIQPPPASKTAGKYGADPTTPRISLSGGSTTITESDTIISIPLYMDKASGQNVRVSWRLVNYGDLPTSSAFSTTGGAITIPAGNKTTTLSLVARDDSHYETNEVVYFEIYNPEGAIISTPSTKLITVIDNDSSSKPTLYFPTTYVEVTEDSTPSVNVLVSISSPLNVDLTIPYLVYGTATYPTDHGLQSGTITFPRGSTSQYINVPIVSDIILENNEDIYIELIGASEVTLGTAYIENVRIMDDEVGATISFLPPLTVTATENQVTVYATISFSEAHGIDTTINFTASGDATYGADYSASSSITIPAGRTTYNVTFTLTNDTKDENDQVIEYIITSPSRGVIGADDSFTINLLDDDNVPTLAFTTATSSFPEGQVGYFSKAIPYTLSNESEKIITIDYALSGTATVDLDYSNMTGFTGTSTGTITINPGTITDSIFYVSHGDIIDEDDETIIVTFSTPSQVNVDATGIITHTATIVDEDAAPIIYFPQSSVLIDEDMVTYSVTVNLLNESQKTITADFSSAVGTAFGAGVDYDFPNGSVITFNPGDTTTTLLVSLVNGEGTVPAEDVETIILVLDTITNASTTSIASYPYSTTLNLVDTDILADFTFVTNSVTVSENATSPYVGVTATLSKISARDITFNFDFSGTATTSAPYRDVLLPTLPITIPAGSLYKTATFTLVNDVIIEATETLTMTATAVTGYATISDVASATFTLNILEDDVLIPQIRFSSPLAHFVTEEATSYNIQIETSRAFGYDVEAYISITASETTATSSPTAYADFDWPGSVTGIATVTIPAYSTTAYLTIDLYEDIADEIDPEAIRFNIDSVSSEATVGSVDTFLLNINDDDDASIVNFEDVTWDATEGVSLNATISINATSAFNISVPIIISSGLTTATASDYTYTPSTLTIPAGSLTATTSIITVTDDLLDEATEHLVLQFGTLVNAVAGASNTFDLSLLDNDAPPEVFFNATSVIVNETNSNILIDTTISLSATSGLDVTFDVTMGLTSTATDGVDYNFDYRTFTIPAGNVTLLVTTSIISDTLDEPDKQIVYQLASPSNVTLGTTDEHTIFIIDDDATPSIHFQTATAAFIEGGNYSFRIELTATSEYDITFDLDYNVLTTASTALGVDHTFATGSLTIPAGSLSVTSTPFNIINDGFYDEEILVVDIVNPVYTSTSSPATITATLIDTNAIPTVRMLEGNIILYEPGAGSPTTYTVTFEQTEASGLDTIITYSISGTAGVGDYTLLPVSPITIPQGSTTAFANITITDDGDTNPNEYFDLEITDITSAATSTYSSLHVLINDAATMDASGSLTPTAVTVAEGATFAITFQINEPISIDVTMGYRRAPSSTATPSDISPNSGTVLISQGSTSSTVVFTAVQDTLDEFDETAFIEITSISTGTLSTTSATSTITITDDDDFTRVSFQSISSSFNESAGEGQFTFTLDNVVGKDVYVPYTVGATSTATNPADHDLVSGTATIAEGNTSVNVTFSIVNDSIDEYNETVVIQMGSPVNALVGTIINHTLTILDNDPAPYVNFTNVSQTATEDVGTITFDITLSSTSEKTMTLPYEYGPNTDMAYGLDHNLINNGSWIIPAGSSSYSATVTIIDDTMDENTEYLEVNMKAPINLELGTTTTASVAINDDDAPPTVQFTQATSSALEGTTNTRIQFVLSAISGRTITVPYYIAPASTASGLGIDHGLVNGSITIAAGQANGYTSNFDLIDDVLTENSETIIVGIDSANLINAGIGVTGTHTFTIVDNDSIKVAIGAEHTCTLLDGGVYCWGDNTYGQRGMGVIDDAFGDDTGEDLAQLTAEGTVDLGTPFVVKQIVAGSYHTCALSTTGSVKCWGLNDEGQLGVGDTTDRGLLSSQMGDDLPAVSLGSGVTATKISAGEKHTCALLSDNSVKCWGSNNSGKLGQPSILNLGIAAFDIFNATPILFTSNARDIASGANHNCARFAGPNLECWGENSDGQLGYDNTADRGGSVGDFTPANYVELNGTAFSEMILGQRHSCILASSTSEAKCFGENTYGQLGVGDTTNRGDSAGDMLNLDPLPLPSSVTIKKMTTGYNHTCTHYSNNTVRCFGRNNLGQLGSNSVLNWGDDVTETASNGVTVNINGTTVMTDVFSGGNHNCAAIDYRTIKCWGNNDRGQLLTEDTVPYGSNNTTQEVTDSATLGF